MPQDDFDPIEILGRIAAKCDLAAVKDGIPEWAKEFFTELGDCFRMLQLSELARLPDHSEPLLGVKEISGISAGKPMKPILPMGKAPL